MERAIGERFTFHDEIYYVADTTNVDNECQFCELLPVCKTENRKQFVGSCVGSSRSDGKDVYFKKVSLEFDKSLEQKFNQRKREEKSMGYKLTHKITLARLMPEVCTEWQDKLVHDFGGEYGFHQEIPLDVAKNYEEEHQQNGWLESHGYIEKEDRYTVGDIVRGPGGDYLICRVGYSRIQAIDARDGNCYRDWPVPVAYPDDITNEEMNAVFNGRNWRIKTHFKHRDHNRPL